ncbi:ribonuclease III [Bradymonas sediminis]|uniref:Ribonuclease 3 n=1 Tax=Bradymonas sediminis TaxID=1548548 RepID=A0A2Z4FLC5_9DELT|nr:ribonuclease III [Bradymonas sediminis]AWV89722.1 ribonuclease III [Bradymonas sediminis]TDP76536.1 RNAse III [Bradymonas sediminis]
MDKEREAEALRGKDDACWAQLQERVGYEFRQLELLVRALTHRSFVNEATQGKGAAAVAAVGGDNQRLEFLGDAVLGVIVSHELFRRDRQVQEGALSTRQAQIVCEPSLAAAARHIDLGKFLRLGRGEHDSGGRDKDSLLADAFEALLAAIYLDGGLDAAHAVVVAHLGNALADVRQGAAPEDYKSRLQTVIQRDKAVQPEYRIIGESGPAHAREFVAEVFVDSVSIGSGKGRSKKVAEQQAAQRALMKLEAAVDAGEHDSTSDLD